MATRREVLAKLDQEIEAVKAHPWTPPAVAVMLNTIGGLLRDLANRTAALESDRTMGDVL